jgi:hypothetical protein
VADELGATSALKRQFLERCGAMAEVYSCLLWYGYMVAALYCSWMRCVLRVACVECVIFLRLICSYFRFDLLLSARLF